LAQTGRSANWFKRHWRVLGDEIVKVGHKSGDFQVEIENRESVRKLIKPSARLMPWPLQQAKSHLLRFRDHR